MLISNQRSTYSPSRLRAGLAITALVLLAAGCGPTDSAAEESAMVEVVARAADLGAVPGDFVVEASDELCSLWGTRRAIDMRLGGGGAHEQDLLEGFIELGATVTNDGLWPVAVLDGDRFDVTVMANGDLAVAMVTDCWDE